MHFCWNPPTETRVHWEKKGGKCMGEGHKKLNFSDCMGLAIGQICLLYTSGKYKIY